MRLEKNVEWQQQTTPCWMTQHRKYLEGKKRNQHQSRLINSILFIFVIELEKYNQSNGAPELDPHLGFSSHTRIIHRHSATLNVTLIIFFLCHSTLTLDLSLHSSRLVQRHGSESQLLYDKLFAAA